MLKTDKEVKDLLEHANNGMKKVSVKIIGSGNHGKGGCPEGADRRKLTIEDKVTVAATAELIGTVNAANLFDMSDAQVSQYKQGENGDGSKNPELKAALDSKLTGITKKIVDRVDDLLDIFAEDKMSELKAHEIPPAAERLVGMFDKIQRRNEGIGNSLKPQVVLYAPRQININELLVKEV